MIKEYFRIAFRNMKVRSLRSWLTILGIVIGIFLITSLMSLSEGLKNSVMAELQMMGGNLIMVMPGDMNDMFTNFIGGMQLENRDIRAIEKVRGVDLVLEMPLEAEIVRYNNESKTSLIYGISYDSGIQLLKEDMGWETVDGRFPYSGRREVMVGNLVPKDIFPGIEVGDEISVKGKKFVVSGVLRSLGNRQDDSTIALDINDFRDITGQREGTPMAVVRIVDGYEVGFVEEGIRYALEETRVRERGEDAPSFSVVSSDAVADMVGNIMGILQAVVIAFASIAIVVGGIGITNTMYTSVRERTKEIGILKAVGAKKKHITSIFLVESGVIGFIGGVGGVVLGILLAKSIEMFFQIHPVFFIEAHVSFSLMFFALGFSFLVGCISGFFPSRSAAKMEPVDALRYE